MTPTPMPVIAIFGPFRARFCWQRWRHIWRASKYAVGVWELGAIAYCPHTSTGYLYSPRHESSFLAGHNQLLQYCDAALTIPGWDESAGARAEVNAMHAQGKPVFESGEALQAWLSLWSTTHDG